MSKSQIKDTTSVGKGDTSYVPDYLNPNLTIVDGQVVPTDAVDDAKKSAKIDTPMRRVFERPGKGTSDG